MRWIRYPAIALIAVVLLWAVFQLSWLVTMHLFTTDIRGRTPDKWFPVLIVTRDADQRVTGVDIVGYADIQKRYPDPRRRSFTLPMDQVQSLQRRLKRLSDAVGYEMPEGNQSYLVNAKFSVRDLGNGKQALRVEGSRGDNGMNVGWYTADADRIHPERSLSVGPGMAFVAMIVMSVLAAVVAVLASAVRWVARHCAK